MTRHSLDGTDPMRNELSLAPRRSSAVLALALLAGSALAAVPAAAAPGPAVLVTSVAGSATAAAEAVRRAGGTVLETLSLVGGVTATLPAGTVLAPSYRVAADSPLQLAEAPASAKGAGSSVRRTIGRGAPAGEGAGITVAVVDTGVADVPDLAGRVEHVNVARKGRGDGYGHGTFVAGLIAGSGASSQGEYAGVAPAARILDVDVADDEGATSLFTVLKGLQVVARHPDVSVLNLSLSSGSELPYQIDPLTVALDALWRQGITVVVPAGNDGTTISSPGSDPLLLTVGALDENGNGDRSDDVVPSWSGRGPAAQGVAKPDLVTPGAQIVSLRAPGSTIDRDKPTARVDDDHFRGSGTSFSTAITSGAVAALLAKRPALRPTQVKSVLTGSAYQAAGLAPATAAGAGGLDLSAALEAPAPTVVDAPLPTVPGDRAHWISLGQAIADRDAEAAASSWSDLSPAARAWVASSWSTLSPETQAWLSMNWAASSWSHAFPAGMNWGAQNWGGMNWGAQNWGGMNWAAINWAAMNWAAINWAGMNWAASSWSGQNWAAQNWAAQNWAAQNWAGMNWAGMNWAASSWSAQNWSAQNWAGMNWSAQNWAGINWSAQNWSAQNWSAQNWSAQNWSAQNWSAQNWSALNWSAQNWSALNWS